MQQLTLKAKLKKSGLLRYLITLTGLFVLLEICVFIQGSDFYLGDYRLVADQLTIPLTVMPGIIYFFCAQLIIHLCFVLLIWCLTCLIAVVFRSVYYHQERLGLGLWLLGLVTILLANQIFFSNSKFAILTSLLIPSIMAKIIFPILLFILSLAILFAMYGLILMLLQRLKIAIGIFGLVCVATVGFAAHQTKVVLNDIATPTKPNIIVIGVDALRPDFLGFFGAAKQTPHMDYFLDHAAVFSESLTPLARTYPAWLSILTGEYPKKINVRFNLSQQLDFDLQQTLPAILQQHGYETIFAMDETRFSNIDETFGFDKTVTPPIGFNDFFLGTLNDFPMSNLLVNTVFGQYLFPYSYGNRPVYTTYNPNSFINLLNQTIQKPRNKPLFLAAHFCLAHYPYVWSDHKAGAKVRDYRSSVNRVDQQVAEFLQMLKKNKLLDHSIVVLLSDHGEAFWLAGDRITEADLFVPGINNKKGDIPRFYPPNRVGEKVNQSVGHGTDVLGVSQYHTLLAFRYFGLDGQESRVIPGRVSLLDIKPTILNFLGIKIPKQSGNSLIDYIAGKKSQVTTQQDFFIESDFSPEAIRTVHPETRKVLFQGIEFFQINPVTTRLTIKKSMADLIISSKQYADFYGPWVLALYPQNKKPMIPILVNLETGLWTNDMQTPLAKTAPIDHMMTALKDFYGDDIKEIESISS